MKVKSIRLILILALLALGVFLMRGFVYSTETPILLEASPRCIAINPVTDQAVVVTENPDELSIIELKTQQILSTIPVGKKPLGVAIDDVNNMALMSVRPDHKLSAIDLDTNQIIATVTVGAFPESIAVDGESQIALVVNNGDHTVSVIDLTSFTMIRTIPVGQNPKDVAIDPEYKLALVVNEQSENVSVIDLNTYQVTGVVPVGKKPQAISINPETHLAVVADEMSNSLTFINLQDWQTSTINLQKHPIDVAFNSLDNKVLAILHEDINLYHIDPQTNTIINQYPINKLTRGVAVNPFTNIAAVIEDKTDSLTLVQLPNPIPVISSITPDIVFRGSQATKVMIEGSGFITTSAVSTLPVTFIDNHQLEVEVPESLLATAGVYGIVVTNPTPSGGASNPINLQINNPVPTLTVLDPAMAMAGTQGVTLTAHGTGFFNDTVVSINGLQRAFTLIDQTKLQINLTATDLEVGGTLKVKGSNLAPGGGQSGSLIFTVQNPVPLLSSLNPTSMIIGSSEFTLTLTGDNFVKTSIVSFNNEQVSSRYLSRTQMEATIPSTAITNPGSYLVKVINPAPGGGDSSPLTFSVLNPAPSLSSINPTSIIAGSPEFTLTLNGDNFITSSIVSFNNNQYPVRFISKTQIETTIPSSALTTAGSYSVKVINPTPGGGESSPITFTVINLQPTVSISANPGVIVYGESSTLSWTSTNAESATIDKGIGNVPLSGSITVSPVGTTTYTITVTGPGGTATDQVLVTVKANVEPSETPQSGYIHGKVFDVNTRSPLPGVLITLRDVQGEVFTNEDGRFSFPTPTKGRYLLTAERTGYAYGQRWVEVMSQRDMAVDSLSLMPLDPQVTTITSQGGTHQSADGKIEVVIPSGAVSQPIQVVTTDVISSESLPAPLPPTSLFTYCVNLRPDDATFTTLVRVRIKNYLNFPAGTPIPVGFYSKKEARWVNHGMSTVTADGQWVEFYTDHFSWYDCNSPGLSQRPPDNITHFEDRDRDKECSDEGNSRVGIKSGNLGIEHKLPSYRSLGITKDIELVYNSIIANPSALISFESEIDPSQTTVPPTITYNLRIEGNMVAARFIGERGKAYWGYLFDGINGRGQRLPTGIYPYRLDLSYDYSTTYARANFFGGPALDSTGVPTRETIPYTTSLDDFLVISNQIDSPFGAGWSLKELERLYIQPDGNLVLVEGNGNAKAVFKRDDISNPLEVDENTILLYHFDGRENKAVDETGRFEGKFYGEGHLVSEGKFGAGATFDGDRDYIRLGNVGAPPQGTVEAWVYFPNGPGINTSYLMIANGGNEYGSNWDCPFDLGVHYGWGGDLRFGLWSGGWRWAASGITPAQLAGGWHHIAGTWGSKGVEIWIDGERKGFNSYTGGFSCPNYPTVFVGTDSWTWDFNGIIDDFRFSSIQRSPGMANYSPLNDHSLIVKNPDSTYTRTLKDGIKINFNSAGLHTSTVDPNGNTTTYSYDGNGLLTSIIDPTGLVTAFAYDGNGRLSSITDPVGRTAQISINPQGNLVSIANPDDTSVSYAYGADHLLIGKTDPRGYTTQYLYDNHHRISEVRAPDGGRLVYHPFDVQGLINDLPQGVGTFENPAPLIKPSDFQVSKTDARGETTNYQINPLGTFDEINDPLGRVTKHEFDKAGNLTKIIRPDGSVMLMTYDDKGNLLTRTDPVGNNTRYTYEPQFNQVTSITDPLGKVSTFGYDAKGNLTRITDAMGNVTNMSYDTRGLMISNTDPLGKVTTFEYDSRGNLASVKDPLSNTTTYSNDASGNTTSMTDAEGKTTQYQYDLHNRLIQVTDPLGGTTKYSYQTGCPDCGGSDRITSITDAKGNTTSFDYDSKGRVVRITDPLGYQKQFSYDPNGNLTSTADPNGNTINFQYDSINRLIRKNLPDDVVTYGYDALNNLTSVVDNNSSISMTYDLAGRLTAVTTGGTVLPLASISYSYDANGNRISMIDKENGVTHYQYDVLNRLISLNNPQGETIAFGYNAVGRRTGISMPHGGQVGYNYDVASRLIALVYQINGGTIANFTYNYDKVSNRTSMIDLVGSHTFGYDDLYRLVGATHPQPANPTELYTYDPVGNRLSSSQYPTWSYDTNNRLLSFDGTGYTYDNNGNMISRTDSSGTTTYQYNSENQLIGINKPNGTVITYRYDPFGKRIERDVNGTITRYLYDGEDILYELDGSNTTLARYTHGPGIDEPLIMERGGANYYYHADGLRSITHITDAAGNIVQAYMYNAFGEIVTQDGTLSNPYTYTSREYDPESGLYYYRARYYDAKIGRFLQIDPIGYAGGDINLYACVANNPFNYIDPEGLQQKGVRGVRKPRRAILPVKPPNGKGGEIYGDIAHLFLEEDRLFFDDPDCVYRFIKVCKKYVCKGEVVCKDRPVIVEDVNKSCWCEEEGWEVRCL